MYSKQKNIVSFSWSAFSPDMALTTTSRQQLTGESSHLGITFFNDLQCCPQAIHPNHLPNCCNNPTRKKQLKNNSAKNKTPSAKTPSTLDPQPVGSGGMRFFPKKAEPPAPTQTRARELGGCLRFSSVNSGVVCCFTHNDSIFGPKNVGILWREILHFCWPNLLWKPAGHEGSFGNFLDPTI